MTGLDVDTDTLARRIADRGQDAVVERVRTAYADAAAAHADLISLDDEQIETMVQSAAANADGLQWRRALAGVASEELGISVTEALTHPAVTRAQALVGAPSYEQSLAELIARPIPPPAPEPVSGGDVANGSVSPSDVIPEPEPPAPEPEPEPEPEPPMPGPSVAAHQSVSAADSVLPATEEHQSLSAAEAAAQTPEDSAAQTPQKPAEEETPDELETVEADDVVLELLPEPDPIEYETQAYDIEATFTEEEGPFEPQPYSAAMAAEPEQYPMAQEAEMPATSAMEIPGALEEPSAVEDPGTLEQPDALEQPQAFEQPDALEQPQAFEQPDALEQPNVLGEELVFPAIHQGGVANLPTKRDGLSVRLSADGLDILHGGREIIGRLIWDEIESLDVPHHRSRRRRNEQRARLVVRTPHGDASFDVPGISADDLRDRIEPIVRLYGRH